MLSCLGLEVLGPNNKIIPKHSQICQAGGCAFRRCFIFAESATRGTYRNGAYKKACMPLLFYSILFNLIILSHLLFWTATCGRVIKFPVPVCPKVPLPVRASVDANISEPWRLLDVEFVTSHEFRVVHHLFLFDRACICTLE